MKDHPEGAFNSNFVVARSRPKVVSHKYLITAEPLAKLRIQGELNTRKEAKAGGAAGHFWHDAVINANTITPAK